MGLAGLVITALVRGAHTLPQRTIAFEESTNTQELGRLLYSATEGYYVFAFEVASVLLLVAVVGAVVMAKRRV